MKSDRNPDRIPMENSEVKEEHELIMFPVKGVTYTVTPTEALSIINHISGSLLAYEHSGGYSAYERKYLSGLPAKKD